MVASSTGDGTQTPGNSGTGGQVEDFLNRLSNNMKKRGWNTVNAPGFGWSAVETEHHDLDTLYGAFDADETDMFEGAHLKLSRWADTQGDMPKCRMAIAVFRRATKDQVVFATEKLQQGNRMGIQSMTAVIDLHTGQLFAPVEVGSVGAVRIRFNKPPLDELAGVVSVLAA